MLNESANLAKFLLEINAIKLSPKNPFTWTSGIKSPIYCDNRMVLGFPHVRTYVKKCLAQLISQHFSSVDVIAGIATAGIPHGALVADTLEKPGCYVRPEPKKHGLQNQIEGNLPQNSKVVLVEDLISTGKSSLQAAEAITKAGSINIGLVALFTYGFSEASAKFNQANIPFYTISNFADLCAVAQELNYITADELALIVKFSQNPQEWGQNL